MIEPMLAETAKEPFDSPDWLFEAKLDGVRCIAQLGGGTTLQGRSGSDITRKFPELQGIHWWARKPCVLDGEIVCDSFGAIQQRIHKEKPLDIRIASQQYAAKYQVFDILLLGDEALTRKPLHERKRILSEVVDGGNGVGVLPFVFEGIALFERAKTEGWEGIMAKRMASTYQIGRRSPDWLKIKVFKEERFLICGLTEGENDRAKTFGSLILGKETDRGLLYVGNCGSGFSEELLQKLSVVLSGLGAEECPFPEAPKLDRRLKHWVKPFLWCEVRYLEYGSDGKLRFPSFRGFVSGC